VKDSQICTAMALSKLMGKSYHLREPSASTALTTNRKPASEPTRAMTTSVSSSACASGSLRWSSPSCKGLHERDTSCRRRAHLDRFRPLYELHLLFDALRRWRG